MPLTHGTLIHRYTHHDKPGRHQVLDARSLEWLHEHTRGVLKPAAHPPRVPVLNQADLLAQGIRLSRAVAGTEDVDARPVHRHRRRGRRCVDTVQLGT